MKRKYVHQLAPFSSPTGPATLIGVTLLRSYCWMYHTDLLLRGAFYCRVGAWRVTSFLVGADSPRGPSVYPRMSWARFHTPPSKPGVRLSPHRAFHSSV